jgi:hypothetical protein
MHAQVWKEEDGKHPTDVLIDERGGGTFPEVRAMVDEHPGTFFVPKPSPKDRDWGCGDLPMQKKDNRLSHMTSNYTGKVVKDVMAQNIHPDRQADRTHAPADPARQPARPHDHRPVHGISGTTGIAAILEGRNFIGIERDPGVLQDRLPTRNVAARRRVPAAGLRDS